MQRMTWMIAAAVVGLSVVGSQAQTPVKTIEELVKDKQLLARGAFSEAEHANRGSFQQVAPVFAGMDRDGEPFEARDASRSDTLELLKEVGMTQSRIETLKSFGIIF